MKTQIRFLRPIMRQTSTSPMFLVLLLLLCLERGLALVLLPDPGTCTATTTRKHRWSPTAPTFHFAATNLQQGATTATTTTTLFAVSGTRDASKTNKLIEDKEQETADAKTRQIRTSEEGVIWEGWMLKLDQALLSENSLEALASAAATDLLSELNKLRQAEMQTAARTSDDEMTSAEKFLAGLLERGPDFPRVSIFTKVWTRLGFLAPYSRRARFASLRRTLDLTTPPPSTSEGEEKTDDSNDASYQRRRRRALIQVLRTLATMTSSISPEEEEPSLSATSRTPAIRRLEKRAAKEAKALISNKRSATISIESLLQRRPSDLETPSYSVLQRYERNERGTMWSRKSRRRNSNIEIRKYDDFAVCSVSMNQTRDADSRTDAAVNEPAKGGVKAFGALAGYLFGKNEEQTAMKMTSPVLTTEDQRMSFVLPSQYWIENVENTAPKPLKGSGVTVEKVEGDTRAVLLFGGYAVNISQRKKELLLSLPTPSSSSYSDAMHEKSKMNGNMVWEIEPSATPVLAQYNDPFTPPWKRLNEVSVAVRLVRQ